MEYIEVNTGDYDNITPLEVSNHFGKKPSKLTKVEKTLVKQVAKAKKIPEKEVEQSYIKARAKTRAAEPKGIKKVGATIKKAAKAVGGAIKKAGQAVIWAPLLPLKGVMVSALNKNGVTTNKSEFIGDIARKFYDNIVKKSKHFDYYVDIDYEALKYDYDGPDHVAGAAVGAIVAAIISFIKSTKERKAAGEPISKTEDFIVEATGQIETQIEEKAKQEVALETGKKLLFDKKTQIIIVVAAVGIIGLAVFLSRRK